jgi:long-chain acyl-CoA synthetase
MSDVDDCIPLKEITNLSQLFCSRVRRSADKVAYHYFDTHTQTWRDLTWSDMAGHVAHFQAAFKTENLSPGDRVALMVSNCPTWVMYEQAAIGLGFIVVPLYTNDRAENVSYIIADAQVRILLLETPCSISYVWNLSAILKNPACYHSIPGYLMQHSATP